MKSFKKFIRIIGFICFLWISSATLFAQESPEFNFKRPDIVKNFDVPKVGLAGVPIRELTIEALDKDGKRLYSFSDTATVTGLKIRTDSVNVELRGVQFYEGSVTIKDAIFEETGTHSLKISTGSGETKSVTIRIVPGILSLFPPLIAILLAFLTRQVLISLFCGIWAGAIFIYNYNPILAFAKVADTYLIRSLANPDHAFVLIFSLTLGGMVGVMSKAGGTQGIVKKLSKYANSPRGGQLATWAMGILIFFDDYANTLVVGNTMRPFTDRLKISREKLSYIVDSTAAPMASVAIISTWVGFQIGLINDAFKSLNLSENAYSVFLQSIPHQTYSIFALIFVFIIGISLRDFGPMHKAESRARASGKVLRDGAQPLTDSAALEIAADEKTPLRWYNALIPIMVVIAVTLLGLYFTGKAGLGAAAQEATLGQIFGEADSFVVLMRAHRF